MAVDIVLIVTLIVSLGDLFVNLATACCSGRTKITTSKIKIEHSEKASKDSLDSDDIDRISDKLGRRFSA